MVGQSALVAQALSARLFGASGTHSRLASRRNAQCSHAGDTNALIARYTGDFSHKRSFSRVLEYRATKSRSQTCSIAEHQHRHTFTQTHEHTHTEPWKGHPSGAGALEHHLHYENDSRPRGTVCTVGTMFMTATRPHRIGK